MIHYVSVNIYIYIYTWVYKLSWEEVQLIITENRRWKPSRVFGRPLSTLVMFACVPTTIVDYSVIFGCVWKNHCWATFVF
jgi:hypothetical protein